MIKTDPRLIKVLETIDSRSFPKLREMTDEAIALLQENTFPKPNSVAIIKARAHLSNSRSKLIGRRLEILEELSLLKRTSIELSNYLIAKYHNYLDKYKNQPARTAAIEDALEPINKKIKRLEAALEAVNHVIADFDSRSFAIRDVIEALKLGERES